MIRRDPGESRPRARCSASRWSDSSALAHAPGWQPASPTSGPDAAFVLLRGSGATRARRAAGAGHAVAGGDRDPRAATVPAPASWRMPRGGRCSPQRSPGVRLLPAPAASLRPGRRRSASRASSRRSPSRAPSLTGGITEHEESRSIAMLLAAGALLGSRRAPRRTSACIPTRSPPGRSRRSTCGCPASRKARTSRRSTCCFPPGFTGVDYENVPGWTHAA